MNKNDRLIKIATATLATLAMASCDGGRPSISTEKATPPAQTTPADAQVVAVADYSVPGNVAPGGNCGLDTINDAPAADLVLDSGAHASFSGWVTSVGNKIPADAVLVLKGSGHSYSVPISVGADRPDVAQSLGTQDALKSGYKVVTNLQNVAAGDYELVVVHTNGTSICPFNHKLTIR